MRLGHLVVFGLLTGCGGNGGATQTASSPTTTPVAAKPADPAPATPATPATPAAPATPPVATTPATPETQTIGTVGLELGDFSAAVPRGVTLDSLQPVISERVKPEVLAGHVALATLRLLDEPVPPPLNNQPNPNNPGQPLDPFDPNAPQMGPVNQPNQPGQPIAPNQGGAPMDAPVGGPQSLGDQLEAQDDLLAGTATHCLDAMVINPVQVNPVSGNACYNDGKINYPRGGTNEPENETCTVITTRGRVERARDLMRATELQTAALCQLAKSGSSAELPAIGATLDLKDALLAAATDAGVLEPVVTYANLTRLADEGGKAVYRTDILVSIKTQDGGHNNTGHATKEVHIVHSVTDEAANTYRGVIWIRQGATNVAGDAFPDRWLSTSYTQTGTLEVPRLQVEVRGFEWKIAASPVLATGMIDWNTTANFTVAPSDPAYGMFDGVPPGGQSHNAVIDKIDLVNIDINPLDGGGSIYTWNNDGNYRREATGLVATFARGEDDKFRGCSVAGAAASGISVRSASHDMTPLGLPVQSKLDIASGLYDFVSGGTKLGDAGACHSVVKTEAEADRDGQCYLKANDGIYDHNDALVVAAPSCATLKVLAEDSTGPGACEIRFHGENDPNVYLQCFAQNDAGEYEIAFPDSSADLLKRVTIDVAKAAPYSVAEPAVSVIEPFTQDVRPTE